MEYVFKEVEIPKRKAKNRELIEAFLKSGVHVADVSNYVSKRKDGKPRSDFALNWIRMLGYSDKVNVKQINGHLFLINLSKEVSQ